MKKCLLLAACLLSGAAVFAQEGVLSSRKAEDGGKVFFNPHWQLQVQAGAAHTVGEAAFKDLLSPAAALSVGYRFTPVWGVRAVLGGWQARGAWVNPLSKYKYNYLQGNVDATLDLGNLFCGYNHRRVFNPYFFAGVGLNGAFNNDEAVALADAGYDLEYLWSGKKISVAGRAGLGADIRLTERLALNLEVNGNVLTDKFNSKKAGNADWQFNALAGFTIKFGKSSKCVAAPVKREETPVQSPMEPVKETPVVEAPVVVEEAPVAETKTVNIFFNINSSAIRASEAGKLDELVDFLQANGQATVSLCGYADAATGTAAVNERLSKQRAQAVADALQTKGIASERITTDYKGDKVQPFAVVQENRVTICIAE